MLLTSLALALLHVRTKTQENFLSVFIFEEAEELEEVKSDGTEEFSVEQALHDRGSYYNQDECAFCPSVFHLFAGSEHSQGPLAGPHVCSTSRFSLCGFLRHGYKKYLEIEEV